MDAVITANAAKTKQHSDNLMPLIPTMNSFATILHNLHDEVVRRDSGSLYSPVAIVSYFSWLEAQSMLPPVSSIDLSNRMEC